MKNQKEINKALEKIDQTTQEEAEDKIREIQSIQKMLHENITYDGSSTSEANSFLGDINYLRNELGEILGIELESVALVEIL